jgi:hypothetical protein
MKHLNKWLFSISEYESLWSLEESHICMFACYLSSWLAVGTIRVYLQGIRDSYVSRGLGNPLAPGLMLSRILRQLDLEKGVSSRCVKRPITTAVLRYIKKYIDFTSHNGRCIWAALCLGVFLLLRIGELLGRKGEELLCEDWRSNGKHGVLRLRTSKVDRIGKGVYLLCTKPGGPCCPFAAMEVFLEKSVLKFSLSRPLFSLENGAQLDSRKLLAVVKSSWTSLGFNCQTISGISLRKGGALSLSLCEVDSRTIRGMGRWAGWCMDRYVVLTPAQIELAHLAISNLCWKGLSSIGGTIRDVWDSMSLECEVVVE